VLNFKILSKKKKIDNLIYKDLIRFLNIDKKNKITVLPDVHQKKGEMSPTGCVLISDRIVPSFTHLTIGSGISLWSIEIDEKFELNKFKKLFKFLQKKIPGKNSTKKKIHTFSDKEIKEFFLKGPKIFFGKKFFKKSFLRNIENYGNFLNKIKNKLSFEDAVPQYIQNIGKYNFGTLGTGNTFIELHEVDKDGNDLTKTKKKLYFIIHSGLPESYLTMFYSPRWGLHNEKFIPFEREKWLYFTKHLVDKNSILNKKKFFPDSSKYFSLDRNEHDGKAFLSAMAYICNISISNRIYLASIINSYLKKEMKIDNMTLIRDCIHDSIQIEQLDGIERVVHRHGASPVYDTEYIKKHLKNNLSNEIVAIPSRPGGKTLIAKVTGKIKNYNYSICHGTGRIYDRPVAKKKFNHNSTKKIINKNVKNFLFSMKNLSGENPLSFRSLEEIVEILNYNKLIKEKLITKPLYILKS